MSVPIVVHLDGLADDGVDLVGILLPLSAGATLLADLNGPIRARPEWVSATHHDPSLIVNKQDICPQT